MRRFINLKILLCIILIISFIQGCGNGENEVKKLSSETETIQDTVEEKTFLPAEENQNMSQEAEIPSAINTQLSLEDIPEEIKIENQGYETDKRNPVTFSHKKHYEEYKITCVQCHHVYEDGKNVWKDGDPVEKCVFCHDPTIKQEEIQKLQSAFHNNCRTCHNEISQEGMDAPYKKCTGCHSE